MDLIGDPGADAHLSLLKFLQEIWRNSTVLTQGQMFLFTIAGVGLLVSWFGFRSIKAAQMAAKNVDEIFSSAAIKLHELKSLKGGFVCDYDEGKSAIYVTREGYVLPHIRGGGLKKMIGAGHRASSWIPAYSPSDG